MILLSVFFVFSMFNLFRIFENELNATILNMGCLDVFLFIFTLFYFPHRPWSIAILSPRRIQKNRVNHFGAFAGKTRGVRLKHGLPPPGLQALQCVQVSIASKKKKRVHWALHLLRLPCPWSWLATPLQAVLLALVWM